MNYEKLERNIIEVMEEQLAKLGFDGNAVYLFYPLSSVASLLGMRSETEAILEALNGFCAHVQQRLGDISISLRDGRIVFEIPPKGGLYVKEHLREDCFIVRLIHLVAGHHAQICDVLNLFRAYDENVHIEKMQPGEEFDYLVYFESGEPDAFYYCLKEDMGHVTYHRFTKNDYEGFGF